MCRAWRNPARGAVDGSVSVDQRIIAHLPFARAVAGRVLDPRCRGADREDLLAWGVVGLVQAAQRYRETEGASFAAYAARRVRGQVLDSLRERDPLTRAARRELRAARQGGADVPPPVSEVSLDRWLEGGSEPRAAASRPARRDPRWRGVRRALRGLSRVERRVLLLSYAHGFTLKEIGRDVGLSESGVCRMRARALRHLRERCPT